MAKGVGMKWHKWKKVRDENPWILATIGFGHLLEPQGSFDARTLVQEERRLRKFVRNKLEFAVFRPFSRLELDENRNDGRDTMEWRHRCDSYFGGNPKTWYKEDWGIVWSVGDRVEYHADPVEWMSIKAKIEEIKVWYAQQCHKGETRTLHFDRAIKVATAGICRPNTRASEMSVEIFPMSLGIRPCDVLSKAPITEAEAYYRQARKDGIGAPPVFPGGGFNPVIEQGVLV